MSSATEVKAALDSAIADTAEAHSIDKEFSRQRKLPLATVLRLLIGAEGGSLTRILRAAGVDATPSALSQRRAQISPDTFREVFEHFNAASTDSARFREKYTLLACDGTALSLPRNPDAPSFVTHAGAPEGFNQLHLTPLYNIIEHTFRSAVIQDEAAKDEVGALTTLLKGNLPEQAIVLLDRGFESYNLMAHMFNKHVDFVLRVKNSKSAMREVARLPMFELDCDISFTITTTQTNEDKQKRHIFLQVPKKSNPSSKTRRARWDFPSPYPMRLRICRFQIDENGTLETIATSLPRSFTLQDIKELYHLRWGIETGFRDLKYSIGLSTPK